MLGMEKHGYSEHAPSEEGVGGTSPLITDPSVIRIPHNHTGTLEALVQQGWTRSRTPEAHEAGPSTWLRLRPPHLLGKSTASNIFYAGLKRRSEPLTRSYSLDAFEDHVRESSVAPKCGKKPRFERREAKGGFGIASSSEVVGLRAKALTDVSMARATGVKPGEEIMSHISRKRRAATSPPIPAGKWIFKRMRGHDDASKQHHTAADNMDLRFTQISHRSFHEYHFTKLSGLELQRCSDNSVHTLVNNYSASDVFVSAGNEIYCSACTGFTS